MFREKLLSFYLVFDDDNSLVAIEPLCIGSYGTDKCLDKKWISLTSSTSNLKFHCSEECKHKCGCMAFSAIIFQ